MIIQLDKYTAHIIIGNIVVFRALGHNRHYNIFRI